MSALKLFAALAVLALVDLTPAAAGKTPPPRPAMTDVADLPLPAGAVGRLGSTRLRNGGGIYDFAFAPDGKLIATAGSGNNMRLWDVATGKLVYEFPETKGRAHCVTFSPDGRHLLSTAGGRSIQVWVMANRTEVALFEDFKESIHRLALSPDGKTLATVTWGNEGFVRLWNAETGKAISQLKGAGGVESVAFSPNNRLVVVAGYHRGVEVWEVATGQLRQKFTKHASQPSSAVVTPDGKAIIVNARFGIHVWDLATEKQLRLFATDRQIADGSLALSPDGKLVAASDLKGTIGLWDLETAKEVRQCKDGHQNSAGQLAFSPDGKILASTGRPDNRLCLWDVATGKLLQDPPGHRAEIVSVDVSPDGNLVATGSSDRTVRIWERATGREVRCIAFGFNHPVGRVAFAPDGKTLAITSSQGQDLNHLVLWDVAGGKELHRLGKDLGALRGLAFAPDGKSVVTAGGGKVMFWEVESGRLLWEAKGTKPGFPYFGAAFAPDGKHVAVALFNREVGLVGTTEGSKLEILGEHRGSTLSVAFTPDSSHLVSGGADTTARLWHMATKKEVQRFAGHGSHVYGVAVSPDGRLLATASLDRFVRLWNLATGEELGCYPGHNAGVFTVAFSRDGKYLVSGSGDCTALVWDVARMLNPSPQDVARLTAKELDGLWEALGEATAERAFKAMRALMKTPVQAVELMRWRLTPVKIRAEVARLIADLDSSVFGTREKASAALEKLGHGAAADLKRALDRKLPDEVKARINQVLEKLSRQKPLPDDVRREQLRALRCVEVLEHLATPQARALLATLHTDDPESSTGREARAALERLNKRSPQP